MAGGSQIVSGVLKQAAKMGLKTEKKEELIFSKI